MISKIIDWVLPKISLEMVLIEVDVHVHIPDAYLNLLLKSQGKKYVNSFSSFEPAKYKVFYKVKTKPWFSRRK